MSANTQEIPTIVVEEASSSSTCVPVMEIPAEPMPIETTTATTSNRKFMNHVRQYPFLVSTKQAMLTLPYTQDVCTLVIPPIRSLRNTEPVMSIVNTGDAVADLFLCQVDRLVPSLKTLEVSDLTSPVTKPIEATMVGIASCVAMANSATSSTIQAVDNTTQKFVVAPSVLAWEAIVGLFQWLPWMGTKSEPQTESAIAVEGVSAVEAEVPAPVES